MGPADEVMKAALQTATRGSHDSAKIAKIREILERAKHEIEGLGSDLSCLLNPK